VLADEDQGVGKQVEGDGQAAALHTHHELVPLELSALFVEDVHDFSLTENARRVPQVCPEDEKTHQA
jgi:hypothetical protein